MALRRIKFFLLIFAALPFAADAQRDRLIDTLELYYPGIPLDRSPMNIRTALFADSADFICRKDSGICNFYATFRDSSLRFKGAKESNFFFECTNDTNVNMITLSSDFYDEKQCRAYLDYFLHDFSGWMKMRKVSRKKRRGIPLGYTEVYEFYGAHEEKLLTLEIGYPFDMFPYYFLSFTIYR